MANSGSTEDNAPPPLEALFPDGGVEEVTDGFPIVVSATSLSGDNGKAWGTGLRNVRDVSAPVSQAPGHIAFKSDRGNLYISVNGASGLAFYVECRLTLSDANAEMHWDATMATSPVSGIMTRVGTSNVYYFSTPFSVQSGGSHLGIRQRTPPIDPDSHWTMHSVTIRAVRRT